MKIFLENWLPRLFPDLSFLCIAHEGKTDLVKSLPRKLKGWRQPDDRFVVLHDQDANDCRQLKASLSNLCVGAGKPETLVRVVCHELEAWYFAAPDAMAAAFQNQSLSSVVRRRQFRRSDEIVRPSRELAKLIPEFQKIDGARRMASHITRENCRSPSFLALITGMERLLQ